MNTGALTIHRADSFASRLFGLLSRPRLKPGEGLYLSPCSSVHTLFMRYSIDVVFVDRDGNVLKLVRGLKPFRMAGCWRARAVVELAAGEAARLGIEPGTRLPVTEPQ